MKELQKALNDEVPDVRMEAIVALAEIGPDSKSAVPDLIAFVTSSDPSTRRPAAFALGRIGAGAKEAVPALRRMLQSRNQIEQNVAAWALVHIVQDPETIQTAIPLIARSLQDSPRSDVRLEAAKTLGEIGKGSSAAKDALKHAASKDTDEAVRKASELALGKLQK